MNSKSQIPPLGHRRPNPDKEASNEGWNAKSSSAFASGADRTVTFVDTVHGGEAARESRQQQQLLLLQEESSGCQTARSHSSNSTYATSRASDCSSVNARDLKGHASEDAAAATGGGGGGGIAGESVVRSRGSSGSARSSSSSSGGKKSTSSKDREARAAQKERIASTKRFMKEKYSTTSTIYATQSIECPDFPRAMFW